MYSTGVIITLLIGGLIAAVASSDDDILCYLQKIESKLDECCNKTGYDAGNGGDKGDGGDTGDGGDAGGKPSCTRDPNSIGSTPIKTITGFYRPFNLYFTDDGTAYLTEAYGEKIHTLDSKGNKLKEVSAPGSPVGIHVKDGVVYVAHFGLNQIVKYSASDLSKIGSFTSPNGPVGVAVDSNGNIYANEYSTGKVNVYNKYGSKIRTMQIASDGNYLRALRFDANETLYTSSYLESTIYISTKEGENVIKSTLKGLGKADGPFVDDNGIIYQPDETNGMVYIFTLNGTVFKKFQSAAKGASDAVIAPDGTLWVVDFIGDAIYLY